MNVVVIMLDSLRQDHVSTYGWQGCPICTPHLDALAAEGIVLDNCYPEGLPTIPVRTDLMTGQSSLTNRPWQPLSTTDVPAAEIFRREGYHTAIVADTYHLFKPDMNFHRGFERFHWIRGAEYDSYRTAPPETLKLGDHVTDRMPKAWLDRVAVSLRNLDGKTEPEDFPCFQTMQQSLRVLEDARKLDRPVFLWIDTFQPHEPWGPPAKFDVCGDPDYTGPKIVMPPGGLATAWGTEDQIRRVRSLYAGDAAYTDWCCGQLFDGMRQMGYFDDTVIVALSDHGHPLADHGKFLKGTDRMYSELLKVPFLVRLPGGAHGGRRATDLARFADLLPTLLDIAGLGANNRAMAGASLLGVLEGTAGSPYTATVSGYYRCAERSVRNERYSYVTRPGDQSDELYDLLADPRETKNLIDEKRDVAEDLRRQVGTIYFNQEVSHRGVQGAFEVADTSLE